MLSQKALRFFKRPLHSKVQGLPFSYTDVELLGYKFGMLTPIDDITLGAWLRREKQMPEAHIKELELMLDLLEPDIDILDAGANIGLYSILFALKEPNSRIIAFEPDPQNFALLMLNLEINNISNVVAYNIALWDSPGYIKMYHSRSNIGDSRSVAPIKNDLGEQNFEQYGGSIPCVRPTTFIPEVLERDVSFSVVKIDTQGADFHILKSITPMIRDNGKVVVEFSPYHLADAGITQDYIREVIKPFSKIERLDYSPKWQRTLITGESLEPEYERGRDAYGGYFDLLLTL